MKDVDKESKEYQMLISAIKEANLHMEPSKQTLDLFGQMSNRFDSLEKKMEKKISGIEAKVDEFMEIVGNAKFSVKLIKWLVAIVLGTVAFMGGLKTLAVWAASFIGLNVSK